MDMKNSQENKNLPRRAHSINIENRERGLVTGVEKVVSSSDTALTLETTCGGLVISGSGLKINKFDIESGALSFEGVTNNIKYSASKVPLLKRMFG